ncbi:MAG: EthD domain-containing protein, partial [Candidatus Lambdaproteobacteria bacterium]|nr:EthD domain-containing protein [Candidatus Lambdaproteobacteria bacterium]
MGLLDDVARDVAGVTIRFLGWLAAPSVLRLNWAHRNCVRYGRSIKWSGKMFKITFCLHRLPHMSREEFQKYWREVHGPMAVKHKDVLGFKRYVQTHALAEGSVPALDHLKDAPAQFDGVAEIWYESQHAYETRRATPEG